MRYDYHVSPNILATCHQINLEAAPILYGESVFWFATIEDLGELTNAVGIRNTVLLRTVWFEAFRFRCQNFQACKLLKPLMVMGGLKELRFCWTDLARMPDEVDRKKFRESFIDTIQYLLTYHPSLRRLIHLRQPRASQGDRYHQFRLGDANYVIGPVYWVSELPSV